SLVLSRRTRQRGPGVGMCGGGIKQVLEAYKKAKNRLIISDYDGTLTTLQSLPQLAAPPAVVTNFLDSLCRDDKNRLFIISGR
ncbi:unnamed protein product, partial [Hapterophycus canaliculatus]